MSSYKITHNNYKSWEISKLNIVQSGKNKGQEYWVFYKHPGTLINAARGLLDEGIGEFDSGDLRELIQKIEKAEQNIIEELRSIKQEVVIELGDSDETKLETSA